MTEENWLDSALNRVKERNQRECNPFVEIYASNQALWAKAVYLDSIRASAKHQIAMIEHETSDYVNKNDLDQALKNAMQKVSKIHSELQPYSIARGSQPKATANLSKVIFDQKKVISRLEDELRMAKISISEAFTARVQSEEEASQEKSKAVQLEEQVASLTTKLSQCELRLSASQAENKELTERIITEKNKSAKQLDEMNEILARR